MQRISRTAENVLTALGSDERVIVEGVYGLDNDWCVVSVAKRHGRVRFRVSPAVLRKLVRDGLVAPGSEWHRASARVVEYTLTDAGRAWLRAE